MCASGCSGLTQVEIVSRSRSRFDGRFGDSRVLVNQLLFGYEDGHRLLAGSMDLPAPALSRLLGATDAPLTDFDSRLLTCLPVPDAGVYALCFTWAAPEITRPGAVWSQVLLVSMPQLSRLKDCSVLLTLARRPARGEEAVYREPMNLVALRPDDWHEPGLDVVEEVCAAAYGDGTDNLVVSTNLAEAERALLLVWTLQWPEVRERFSFRTRDMVRPSSLAADVVVARRRRGSAPRTRRAKSARWLRDLADATRHDGAESRLRGFLWDFGPYDRPDLQSVRALAEIHASVARQDTPSTRRLVEGRYPTEAEGAELKEQLFSAGETSRWRAAEVERVAALLGARQSAWDVRELRLAERTRAEVARGSASILTEAVATGGVPAMRETFLQALLSAGAPNDVPDVMNVDQTLGTAWLQMEPQLLRSRDAWSRLDGSGAEKLLREYGQDDGILVAAIQGGHVALAVELVGIDRTLGAAAHAGDVAVIAEALAGIEWRSLPPMRDFRARIALGAVVRDGRVPGLEEALEYYRGVADELWLRAAARLLVATDALDGRILEIVFGPLHHAITDNRLPRSLWSELDEVLPQADDPALRLRRALLAVARQESWSESQFRRALRDAGPYAVELRREFRDEDPWTSAFKAFTNFFPWS